MSACKWWLCAAVRGDMNVKMSAAASVTSSQPLQRDIDIIRFLDNITHTFFLQNETKEANQLLMKSHPSPDSGREDTEDNAIQY